MKQGREHVGSMLNSISCEVRSNIQEWEFQIKGVKHANEAEIKRINNAISSLEAKITASVANNIITTIQQTAMFRTTALGETESIGVW